MWSRAELKSRVKDYLRRYYWAVLVATFLVGILSGGNGDGEYGSSGASVGQQINQTERQIQYYGGGMGDGMSSSDWALLADVMTVVTVVFLVIMAVTMLLRIFVGDVMTVGGNRYFMESRAMGRSAGVGKAFCGFDFGSYLNIVKTQLLEDLLINLWSPLLIVPGVIRVHQYYMVPCILSENPDMRYRDALDLSRQVMDDHKWDTFVLELSFTGWYLLGLVCCRIGVIFVEPYAQATVAELYAVLRENVGYTRPRGSGSKDGYYNNVVSEQ